MGVSVQVSFYPLGAGDINEAVGSFVGVLAARGLVYDVGSMSTVVWGDSTEVFAALQEAYERATERRGAVMVMTVSNACPVPIR